MSPKGIRGLCAPAGETGYGLTSLESDSLNAADECGETQRKPPERPRLFMFSCPGKDKSLSFILSAFQGRFFKSWSFLQHKSILALVEKWQAVGTRDREARGEFHVSTSCELPLGTEDFAIGFPEWVRHHRHAATSLLQSAQPAQRAFHTPCSSAEKPAPG